MSIDAAASLRQSRRRFGARRQSRRRFNTQTVRVGRVRRRRVVDSQGGVSDRPPRLTVGRVGRWRIVIERLEWLVLLLDNVRYAGYHSPPEHLKAAVDNKLRLQPALAAKVDLGMGGLAIGSRG